MSNSLWDRASWWVRQYFNHYVRRCCTCHKFPWQDWDERNRKRGLL